MANHTYADYLTWSASIGDELIEGIAYVGEPRAYVAPFDVRLPKDGAVAYDQLDTVVQPDILIVRDLQKLGDRGMCGAPDWIVAPCEIAYSGAARTAGAEGDWGMRPWRYSTSRGRLYPVLTRKRRQCRLNGLRRAREPAYASRSRRLVFTTSK